MLIAIASYRHMTALSPLLSWVWTREPEAAGTALSENLRLLLGTQDEFSGLHSLSPGELKSMMRYLRCVIKVSLPFPGVTMCCHGACSIGEDAVLRPVCR